MQVQQNVHGFSLWLWGPRRESSCLNIAHLDLWCGNVFLEGNSLVNNIKADNAWLLTAAIVTSTPRVPFVYPRLTLYFWKVVRLCDSLSISCFHKSSLLCSISSYEPDRNLWESHQERMTLHSTVLLHVIRGRGFESRSRDRLFQEPAGVINWHTARVCLCT